MPSTVRVWIVTGALFLALLPTLPLELTSLRAGMGDACTKQGGVCCQLMAALQSHYQVTGEIGSEADDCTVGNCKMRSQPGPEGAPVEGSTLRQAVAPKAALAGDGPASPASFAGEWLGAREAGLPATPYLEIQVPPPRPLLSA